MFDGPKIWVNLELMSADVRVNAGDFIIVLGEDVMVGGEEIDQRGGVVFS